MHRHVFASATFLFLVSCGGLSDDTVVAEMDEGEIEQFCEEFSGDDTTRTVTCDFDGAEFTFDFGIGFDDVATCTSEFELPPEGCTATIGDLRACNEAMLAEIEGMTDEEICNSEETVIPAACDPIFADACIGA